MYAETEPGVVKDVLDISAIKAAYAIQALQERNAELERALKTATELVDLDVIRVRPTEREFLLDWLENANSVLSASIRSLKGE